MEEKYKTVATDEYVEWFINFINRKPKYYDFIINKYINPNKNTENASLITYFYDMIEHSVKKVEDENGTKLARPRSKFFPKPYRVVYNRTDENGNINPFYFMISSGVNGISACVAEDEDLKKFYHENGKIIRPTWVNLNYVLEDLQKELNGHSKRK